MRGQKSQPMPTSHKTIGVIGLGSIGMRHAKNLLAMGHQVRGYDTDMKKRLALNGVLWNMGEVLDSDAVIIASPTPLHYLHVISAAEKGIPMLVEKPIADSCDDWLRDAIAHSSVMVGNNLRMHSCVKKAREWLDAGLIGRPLWANFTLAQFNDKYTDDVILNWGAHELDLARYLLGDCEVVAASHASGGIADIILRHGNGCQTVVHLDYVTRPHLRVFRIVGSLGMIGINLEKRTAFALGPEMNVLEMKINPQPSGSWDDDYIEEMKAFLDLIDGKLVPHAATGEDGLAVLELILEAKRMAGI